MLLAKATNLHTGVFVSSWQSLFMSREQPVLCARCRHDWTISNPIGENSEFATMAAQPAALSYNSTVCSSIRSIRIRSILLEVLGYDCTVVHTCCSCISHSLRVLSSMRPPSPIEQAVVSVLRDTNHLRVDSNEAVLVELCTIDLQRPCCCYRGLLV